MKNNRTLTRCVETSDLVAVFKKIYGEDEFEYKKHYFETDFSLTCVGDPQEIKTEPATEKEYEEWLKQEKIRSQQITGRYRAKFFSFSKKRVKIGWKENLIKIINSL